MRSRLPMPKIADTNGSSRRLHLRWEGKKIYRQIVPTPRLLEPVESRRRPSGSRRGAPRCAPALVPPPALGPPLVFSPPPSRSRHPLERSYGDVLALDSCPTLVPCCLGIGPYGHSGRIRQCRLSLSAGRSCDSSRSRP